MTSGHRDRKPGRDGAESREEAREAIANALDFLRREAAALDMHEVSDMIGRIRVRVRHCETKEAGKPPRH